MEVLFIEYPKCSTCRKARAWLEAQGVAFTSRHIVEEPPTAGELAAWQQACGLPLRRFFNTSGLQYRALSLKDRLDGMSGDEQLDLLATDGMLVKRPLLVVDGVPAAPGFKEAAWRQALGLPQEQ